MQDDGFMLAIKTNNVLLQPQEQLGNFLKKIGGVVLAKLVGIQKTEPLCQSLDSVQNKFQCHLSADVILWVKSHQGGIMRQAWLLIMDEKD